jgi:hypothetical protein
VRNNFWVLSTNVGQCFNYVWVECVDEVTRNLHSKRLVRTIFSSLCPSEGQGEHNF